MAGYHNFSMSNNAVAAYSMGRMPLSKWTKTAIIEAAAEYLESMDDSQSKEKLALLSKCKLANLKQRLLHCTEWHHTSKHYNMTDFYSLNEMELDELTADRVAEWNADDEKPPAPAEPTRKLGSIDYIIWGGTRKHPKAFEHRMENVEIEERGCFYLVYSEGKQVLKKKIGSNGTRVHYI